MCPTIATCLRDVIGRRRSIGSAAARTRLSQPDDKAIQIMQKLVEEYPDVPDYSYDLCETYAIEADRSQFSSRQEIRAGGGYSRPPDPFSSEAADSAARQRSREMLEKALAISEELVAKHPNIPDYAVSQVFIRLRLAGITQESDRAGAESNLRKALDLQSAPASPLSQNFLLQVWNGNDLRVACRAARSTR